MRPFIFLPLVFLLPGCVASVVGDVVTAPIKVVSKTADDAACMRYEALEAEIAAEKDRID